MENNFDMYRFYHGEEISPFQGTDQNANMFWFYEKVFEEQYQRGEIKSNFILFDENDITKADKFFKWITWLLNDQLPDKWGGGASWFLSIYYRDIVSQFRYYQCESTNPFSINDDASCWWHFEADYFNSHFKSTDPCNFNDYFTTWVNEKAAPDQCWDLSTQGNPWLYRYNGNCKLHALSEDPQDGIDYIVEGDNIYYLVKSNGEQLAYQGVTACTRAAEIASHRINWTFPNPETDIPDFVMGLIVKAKKIKQFQVLCKQQILKYGEDKYGLDSDGRTEYEIERDVYFVCRSVEENMCTLDEALVKYNISIDQYNKFKC